MDRAHRLLPIHRDVAFPCLPLVTGLALMGLAFVPSLSASDDLAPETEWRQDASGFLYGTVELRTKSYEGRLTFGSGDMFWNEFLDSNKEKRPFLKAVPKEARLETVETEIFGRTVTETRRRGKNRAVRIPYGEIERIEAHSRAWSQVVMRDGTELELSGGRDLTSRVIVHGADGEETKIPWQRILRIRFAPVPEGFSVERKRVYAKVESAAGPFEGFLQWDRDERFADETLDGEPVEGGAERNIPLAEIVRIEKIDDHSTRLTLRDGEVVALEGTNDVNRENRGIWIHDKTWGLVGLDWETFESLELVQARDSGPGYEGPDSEGAVMPSTLHGRVETGSGAVIGRLIYDVDEAYGWETLDGDAEGVTYAFLFDRVRTVEPLGPEAGSRVTLVDGSQVELRGSIDVEAGNDGVVVLGSGGATSYVPWADIKAIHFERPAPAETVPAP